LEDGVDVISVGALAFKRFLALAARLNLDVRVVTDNDGNAGAVATKYEEYSAAASIKICFSDNDQHPSLEDQLLAVNSRETLNEILDRSYESDDALLAHMKGNKTKCALQLFETGTAWDAPR